MRRIEVSHQVSAGMKTYPGLPAPEQRIDWTYDSSRKMYGGEAEFYIASLHLCGNTGTYVDAPVHRFRGAADLAALPLERLAHVEAVVVRVTDQASGGGRIVVDAADLHHLRGSLRGKAVLLETGWSRHWGKPEDYFRDDHPFLTEAAARMLAGEEVALVGIDSLNIDDRGDMRRPVHTALLGAGIPICEHMTGLDSAPAAGGYLHAVPIAWVGGASFPVRAYVLAEG